MDRSSVMRGRYGNTKNDTHVLMAWPTIDEAINGSWSVVVTVLFLMAFLAGADMVLGRVARTILNFGGG